MKSAPTATIGTHERTTGTTAFTRLIEQMRAYSPEWAAPLCDVPAAIMRRVANEYLANASVGETIEIDGNVLPFRPVAVVLGKTVNNGWGGYECCWAALCWPRWSGRWRFRAVHSVPRRGSTSRSEIG